jgi:hypothetical protein
LGGLLQIGCHKTPERRWHSDCIELALQLPGSVTSMLKEASSLPQAAADSLDALLHLSLLAAASGYPDCGRAAQLAIHELLKSPDAGCVIPAEYLGLDSPAHG